MPACFEWRGRLGCRRFDACTGALASGLCAALGDTAQPCHCAFGTAARSGASDSIDDTIHYGEVCDAVRQSLSNQTFLLLEALAEYVAELLIQDFGALWVQVRVVKPGILPNVREVGVEIERSALES